MVGLAVAAFLALFVFDVGFPVVVAAAGLTGFLGVRARPDLFGGGGGHGGKGGGTVTAAVIDADPHHLAPSPARSAGVIAVWGGLWAAPIVGLAAVFGPDAVFVTLAGFFSKMAVVTFGGAYAVLAYVAQEAVDKYHWLTAPEMLAGLGLAETTPGPLILVLQFVGFLAGYRESGIMGGVGASLLTLLVTFAPCFAWIFLGAPFVEKLHEAPRLKGALAGVTAAVVGVIANLAFWFGLRVIFTEVRRIPLGLATIDVPVWSTVQPSALGLALLAAVLLFGLKWGLARVLGVSAVAGLVVSLLAG